ncbi:two-component sensor histidine kinase [Planomonospora parontospora subsp. parontospora]|uniref:histidine kinase n=2 Tax=Planomonospora parontospora TaxID=58119 RepID=A0AA37F3Y9_9ACTN|nr:HAMP domain-containing sensor histidine kinase [Planomonospora parontospora]GGK61420.1 two-component sensor histidine kinase [Planomonospora parontospora]GII08663.1 two-component sensor histidine kinase [Planomonospora parontospora subsp. parontospora]
MSRLSVRVRATLAATAIVAVALAAASALLVGVLSERLMASASDEAFRRAGVVAERISGEALPVPDRSAGRAPGAADPDVQILTEAAHPLAGAEFSVHAAPALPAERWAPEDAFVTATAPVGTAGGTVVVRARASLEPAQAALQTLRTVLLPGIPALLLLVAALTWLAVGRALAPVSAIRAELADITASDLHRRVPVPRSRDEIARLAETTNRTLDRLELAVGRHRRFVADAAHELRSPLAVLRARLELAPPQSLTAEALADVARIQALTSDLLLLARLDADEPVRHDEVDLGQVAAEEGTRVRPRPEVRVALEIAADVLVRGSAEQLRRLVANLVDNAVRHAESAVTVRLAAEGDEAVLEVRDDGPGIPAEHHEAVFDRFTRLDEARDRDAGGAGLGLAIARDVAVRHGGGLAVASGPPGACLRARLPLAPPAGAASPPA